MSVVELRKKIIAAIQGADEQYLKQLEAFMYSNSKGSSISDEHKQIIDERLAQHKANPQAGRSWQEIKTELSPKYGA